MGYWLSAGDVEGNGGHLGMQRDAEKVKRPKRILMISLGYKMEWDVCLD